jgi:hypothetical protein
VRTVKASVAVVLVFALVFGEREAAADTMRRGGKNQGWPAVAFPAAFVDLLNLSLTGDCEGNTPSGMTFSRTTAATCPKADGSIVTVSSGQARMTSRGLLREMGATNPVLHNRDASQSAWTKTNATCARTAIGTDASANTASTCTATASSATVLQGVTASGSRNSSFYLRRRTGSGTVEVTRDGATWIDVTASLTSSWVRLSALTHSGLTGSVTNPVVGIRIATSGDAVDMDRVQDEPGTFATMPVDVAGTAATRNADVFSVPTPASFSAVLGCAYICFEPEWTGSYPTAALYLDAQAATGRAWLFYQSISSIGAHNSVTAPTVASAHVAGVNKCYLTTWSSSGGTWRVTNVSTSTAGTAVSYATPMVFGATTYVGSQAAGSAGVSGFFSAVRLNTTTTGCQP